VHCNGEYPGRKRQKQTLGQKGSSATRTSPLDQDSGHWCSQPQGQRGRPLSAARHEEAAEAFVREIVSNKVSLLATDESKVYGGLTDYNHQMVDHSRKQYVIGAVHTNTIEGFCSIFKRGVVGTFHKMSAKYMPLYVAEFQFRYNNRFNSDIFGTAISGC
jgi:hypothetical protein